MPACRLAHAFWNPYAKEVVLMPTAATGILFGQIFVVLGVALGGVWAATQWTAHALGYQPRLGLA